MHEYVGRIKMLPEVRDAYMTWDMYIKMLEEDKFKEGREKGELIKLISVIKKKIMKKKHIQEISEEIEEDENVVEPIYQFIMEHNGMDVEEIAEMLNVHQSTVSRGIKKSIEKIRSCLTTSK